ncbi:diaminopimelate epimerase [Ilumatobacter nonamiensis]|uniref:diaminopimelate epimerase n=1 Tax=Ilumatobacter nonamiensis TaxID=467093 RepID=UPI00034BF4CE|nr:diaminopimelate epimerase [Ilumatobacter nonamiensis]
MTRRSLTKHHGLGNDFLVLFDDDGETAADDLARLAVEWCDRRTGIGADGLLVATSADGYAAKMTLFNADGSVAEMSGNGIRCFAQAVAERRGDLGPQLILTDAGDKVVTLAATDDPGVINAQVEMGPVTALTEPDGWGTLGCHPDRPVAHLSMGNPHSVVGVDEVAVVDLADLGSKVPQVNLEIIEPGPETNAITMRVHERGAGITAACGTGACAAAFAARSWGLVTPSEPEVVVHMDGGTATVALTADEPTQAILTGPATFVATIEIGTP